MNNPEIALQLTLKALEQGMIIKKDNSLFDGNDPIEDANQHFAKQVSDFYEYTLKRLNEI